MNLKLKRALKAVIGTSLAVIMVFNSFLISRIEVNAANTLKGVQDLIDEVSSSSQQGKKFTILEIVEDVNNAEIGYLFDGFEPAISERSEQDGATGTWKSWRTILGQCANKNARSNKFGELASKLSTHNVGGAVEKVGSNPYEEKVSSTTGFERIDFGVETKKGYFILKANGSYNLNFKKVSDSTDSNKVYYNRNLTEIKTDGTQLPSDENAFLYKKVSDEFIYVGQWKDVKESIKANTMSLFSLPNSNNGNDDDNQRGSVSANDSVSGNTISPLLPTGVATGVLNYTFCAMTITTSGNSAMVPTATTSGNSVIAPTTTLTSSPTPTLAYKPDYYYGTFSKSDRGELYEVSSIIKVENGAYDFTDDQTNGQEYSINNGFVYSNSYFKNNEWFKKYVLNMNEEEYDSFPVEVITYTYSELNAMTKLPKFDFLYLNGTTTGDLNADIAGKIFDKVLVDKLPCIVDGDLLYSNSTTTNLHKLCQMLGQKSLSVEDKEKSVDELKTFPNANTDKTYATEQVFVLKPGESLVNDKFNKKITNTEGFKKVYETIEMENLYRKMNNEEPLAEEIVITPATVIRHIMNFKNMKNQFLKTELKVLELHPTKATAELSLKDIQLWAPMVEKTKPIGMSTSEFNSCNISLNSQYDLIYISASADYQNVDSSNSPVYNNSKLNSYHYHATGDKRVDYLYNGNDITVEKKAQLLHYLNGNYPIIVSEDVKAEPNSNMQKFLDEAKEYENFFMKTDLKEDIKTLQFYLNQPKVGVSLVLNNGEADPIASYNTIGLQDDLYKFQCVFKIDQFGIIPKNAQYLCKFRIDVNGDGKFTDDELISKYNIDGKESTKVESLVANKQYVLEKDFPSNFKGILPWSIEISMKTKPSVSDSIQGFTKLISDKPEEIKILQICEDGSNILNLNAALGESHKEELFYKLVHQVNGEYDIDVTYCSLQDYKDRILGNAEKNIIKNPEFLKDYNMLLFGVSNGTLNISDEKLLKPIRDYMNAGKSVLFTRSAWDLKEKLKPSGGYTYTYINSITTEKNETDKYFNLNQKSLLKGDKRTVNKPYISKANIGMLTNYPYTLGEFQIAPVKGGTYQMNLNNSTVWYCISENINDNGNGEPTAFSLSPNDGANNYYLYSQGNVVCSGFAGSGTEEELKLFVNTIIATYHAGIKSPTVDFLKEGRYNATKISAMYRYFDGDGEVDSVDTEKIYFRVTDTNFSATELAMPCSFFYEVKNEGVKVLPCTVKDAVSGNTIGATDSKYYLQNNHLYYFEVSKDILKKCEKGLNLYIDVQSKFKLANKPCETEVVRGKLEVIKAYLWDLR